jgi:hypothetical protein
VTSPPTKTAQGPTAPLPTAQPQPGSDPSSLSAVGQLTSERNDAPSQGVPWLVLVGAVLVAGVVIVVANRIRKRRSR